MKNTKSGSGWYEKWHDSDHHFLVHWGIFLIIVVGVWALLYTRIGDWVLSSTDQGVTVQLAKDSAQLILEPQMKTIKVGDVIAADIILDTGNSKIDGVDIYALHYDPTLLKVIDDLPNQSGTQIRPGEILSIKAANIVDAASGSIKFSGLANGGTSFEGRGVLATVHFKALAAGTAYLKFDFRPGNTIDSNAAFLGRDRLARVVDAIYTIESK